MAERAIRKCVVPAAGLGTRFLPATKAIPKEMLPIVDTPTLQYIVEEAAASGLHDVILINGRGKSSIEDHFDIAVELEGVLGVRNKARELKQVRAISELANVVSVRQKQPLGLGHAVLCARPWVGEEPFAVILGDDLIDAKIPAVQQLARAYQKHQKAVIALMEVPPEEAHLYGIVAGTPLDDRTLRIDRIVEKPPKGTAPSNLAVVGRYLLPPSIFPILASQAPGVGGEIQLTDGLSTLREKEGLLGYRFEGERYDAGDRVGYVRANVAYALKRPELKGPLLQWLRQVVREAASP